MPERTFDPPLLVLLTLTATVKDNDDHLLHLWTMTHGSGEKELMLLAEAAECRLSSLNPCHKGGA